MTVVGDTTEMYSHDVNLFRRLSTAMAIAAMVNARRRSLGERREKSRVLSYYAPILPFSTLLSSPLQKTLQRKTTQRQARGAKNQNEKLNRVTGLGVFQTREKQKPRHNQQRQ